MVAIRTNSVLGRSCKFNAIDVTAQTSVVSAQKRYFKRDFFLRFG